MNSMPRVIDAQDDLGAAFMASSQEIPEILKEGSVREGYELLDRDFALILVDENGHEHRKFACYDAGNTWMSLWYLEHVPHGLPDFAVKIASGTLAEYAHVHGIDLQEMFPLTARIAASTGQTFEVAGLKMGSAPDPTAAAIFEDLHTADANGENLALHLYDQAYRPAFEQADGDPTHPHFTDPHAFASRKAAGHPLVRALEAKHNVRFTGLSPGTSEGHMQFDFQPLTSPVPKQASARDGRRLDERRVRVKQADFRPLPRAPRRELGDFDKVAAADRNWDCLAPHARRGLALELEQVSGIVDIPEKIAAYMGQDFGPRLEVTMKARAERVAKTAEAADGYRRVLAMSKAASITPEDAVEAIHILDEVSGVVIPSGYGPRLLDPYACVYGLHKEAMWSWTHGTEYVNEPTLRQFAASPASGVPLKEMFDDALTDRFRANPVETFKSMPLEQQKIVARLAAQAETRGQGAFRT